MRPSNVLCSALVVTSVSAWPSIFGRSVDAIKREIAPLLVERQDSDRSTTFNLSFSASSTSAEETESASRTESSSRETSTNDSNDDDEDEDEDSSRTTQGPSRTSGGRSNSTATYTSGQVFDPRLPQGGVSMITPDAMSPASFYKIKDPITFVWNYTSLSLPPHAIDVLATCTANDATYTIAANQSWEQVQTVVWDTGDEMATGTNPLLTETYTLIVHDAAKDASATAAAGYLGAWKQYTFGMYVPQPYTPMASYVCATCSSAMSLAEKQTWGFMFGMVGVTVLSFSWFAGMAGLW